MYLLTFLFYISLVGCKDDEMTAPQPDNTMNESDSTTYSYLALGDSYTIGTSLDDSTMRFPTQLTERLKSDGLQLKDPKIIAENGWTTGDLIEATNDFIADSAFNLVSLLIGVNNQYAGDNISNYEKEFTQLLQRAIDYAGGDTSQVFVLSIPDYGVTPFAENDSNGEPAQISQEIAQYNDLNRKITEGMGVSYYGITEISQMAADDLSLLASDGLHPSGKMYELWVNEIYNDIKNKLDE